MKSEDEYLNPEDLYSKGFDAYTALEEPKDFYKNYKGYSELFLKNGINLWNSNIIKIQIIPELELDKIKLYYMNKNYMDMTEEDKRMRDYQQILVGKVNLKPLDLDLPNILMGIAVERILKGFLLNNRYAIHWSKKRDYQLIPITSRTNLSLFRNKVYSLDEFTKLNILKGTLPWENEEELKITSRSLKRLKLLRDSGVHSVPSFGIIYDMDIILFKIVNDLMNKAVEVMKSID